MLLVQVLVFLVRSKDSSLDVRLLRLSGRILLEKKIDTYEAECTNVQLGIVEHRPNRVGEGKHSPSNMKVRLWTDTRWEYSLFRSPHYLKSIERSCQLVDIFMIFPLPVE